MDQEEIQSSSIPDQDTKWGNDKNTRKHHITECQEVKPFSTDDLNAASNIYHSMATSRPGPSRRHGFDSIAQS